MFRKILTYTGWGLLVAILGAYFFCAEKASRKFGGNEVCKSIKVTLLDSAQNKFVAKSEVIDIIENYTGTVIGKKREEINLANIEQLLDKRSAIRESQVSIDRNGVMAVDITQRRPLLRIETANGGFYIDETAYIFPLVESFTSYVPIVTGHIPLLINPEHRGQIVEDPAKWIDKIIEFGLFLNENPFWDAMVEQIYIEKNGDVILSPKVGEFEINLGDLENLDSKFSRLLTFYKNIAPYEGWEKYRAVSLKYKDQIICSLKKNKK
ncbi:MAG: hypothetical protein IKD16_03460 [Bacteroidales bacterium]|nr:hypothetical protein [Bacteroidales bacterium]